MTRELVLDAWCHARANVNIALVKYWGKAQLKRPEDVNLPAVPSLSLTLDGLFTLTRARFAPELEADRIVLDGAPLLGEERARAVALLDALRRTHGVVSPFEVVSDNHVPTAAGLASSASGMAALAAAAGRLVGLDPTADEDARALSALARVGSGSAARSVFGGWVVWDGPCARPLAPADHLPIAVVIAVVARGRKPIGSRDAMNHTAETSPYHGAWVAQAHATFDEAVDAVRRRDFDAIMHAMERSTWRMHAAAMAADPPVFYWQPASVAVLREVERMRADGIACGATLDAGPNVKVFCRPDDAGVVVGRLTSIPGVGDIFTATPGEGVQVHVDKSMGPSPTGPASEAVS
ncbi:MAG: diphosphomevalonate decarboxylase [Deltaproteobacteria bacterium]|nr:diphosphomevalonate decarboxylase [Deltaproteobacteria bacterium]